MSDHKYMQQALDLERADRWEEARTVQAEAEALAMSDMPAAFAQRCGDLSPGDCGIYFLVSQFLLMFMLLPLAIPATIASYSIVGEKITRTLEPLLATPISTLQLLVGKAAAAVTPRTSPRTASRCWAICSLCAMKTGTPCLPAPAVRSGRSRCSAR